MNKKWFVSLLFAALVALLAACSNGESADDNKDSQKEKTQEEASGEKSSEQAEQPKPDLEGIPEVVAKVNGEEIPKKEFKEVYTSQFPRLAMQSQMTGQKMDQDKMKKMVAESLVGQKLLIQEANNRDFKVTEKEKNETLTELAKQNQMESKEKFLSALKEQGMSEKEVMSQVETQIKMDKLIASESGDLAPTEEEMKKAYDQMKAQQEKSDSKNKVPSYEEIKPTIKEQLRAQNENQAYQKLVEKLRKDAEVTVNL